MARRRLLLVDKDYTANASSNEDPVDVSSIQAPYILEMLVTDLGTSPDTESYDFTLRPYDPGSGTAGTTDFIALTAATDAGFFVSTSLATEIPHWIVPRPTITMGTANDGVHIKVWLVGATA
jgi:hypothetical protein